MSNFQRGPRQDNRDFRNRDRDRNSQAHSPRGPNSANRNGPFNRNAPPNRMNPWEGGVAPGNNMNNMNNLGNSSMGNNNRPSGGLLPTPTMPPGSGLLQQFSTQEVQLAIANNVLSALLPTLQSQQNLQQNQVPPLLSLNANRGPLLPLSPPPLGSFPNHPNPNFGGPGLRRDNMGPGPGPGPDRSRPLMSGRRPEPYKMGNRNQRQGPNKNADHKGANASFRNAGRNASAGGSQKNVPQQPKINKLEDSKKGDGRKDNMKKTDEPSKDKSNEANKNKEKDKVEAEKSKVTFADVPSDLFFCHVCSKHMWDAVSFCNHMKGRAHQMMMDEREESYRLKIDLMRHELKVDEQQRQIALERKQRQGKTAGAQGSREYCTMCDLHFVGNIAAHRKHTLHQKLKSFLHPKCEICQKEFPTRIEYDQHLLTAGHLKTAAKTKSKGSKTMGDVTSAKNESENCETDNLKTGNDKSEDTKVKTPVKANELPSSASVAVGKVEVKKEDTPFVIPDTVKDEQSVPTYDASKEIGTEMLQEKTGYLCKCCNRFLSSSQDAKTHCRSHFHFEKYVTYLNNKVVPEIKSPKVNSNEQMTAIKKEIVEPLEDTNGSEKVQDEEEEEKDDDKEDEGNWKRRKVVQDDDAVGDVAKIVKLDETTLMESNSVQEPPETKTVDDGHQSTTAVQEDSANLLEKPEENDLMDKSEEGKEITEDTEKTFPVGVTSPIITEDLEKTLLLGEKVPTPKSRRGRGGTAVRSRGRKRK